MGLVAAVLDTEGGGWSLRGWSCRVGRYRIDCCGLIAVGLIVPGLHGCLQDSLL
jgi:hypothetical protein